MSDFLDAGIYAPPVVAPTPTEPTRSPAPTSYPVKTRPDTSVRRGEALASGSLLPHLTEADWHRRRREGGPRPMIKDTTQPDFLIMLRHMNHVYMVVFTSCEYTRISSIWQRQPDMSWGIIWSFLKPVTPTQRIKNIAAKGLMMGQQEAERMKKEALDLVAGLNMGTTAPQPVTPMNLDNIGV